MTHPGVYEIVHVPSGRRYIGSAKNVSKRLLEHYHALRRGDHPTPRLQNTWNKYGEDAFQFSLIEACLGEPTILFAREQMWLDKNKKRLLNARSYAEQVGYEWRQTDEAKIVFEDHAKAMKEWWSKREPVTKKCEYCGNAYKTRSTNHKARFCSLRCSRAERPISPKRLVTTQCKTCGIEFQCLRGATRDNCSPKCGVRSSAVLATTDIAPIIERAVDGEAFKAIGRDFGISRTQVERIVRRVRWGDVEIPNDLEERRLAFLSGKEGVPKASKKKLSKQAVFEMLDRIHNGESQSSIAKSFGISQGTVSDIKVGRTKAFLPFLEEYYNLPGGSRSQAFGSYVDSAGSFLPDGSEAGDA